MNNFHDCWIWEDLGRWLREGFGNRAESRDKLSKVKNKEQAKVCLEKAENGPIELKYVLVQPSLIIIGFIITFMLVSV